MSIGRVVAVLAGSLFATLAACSWALASTVTSLLTTPSDTRSLSYLMSVDALGYACVWTADVELNYSPNEPGVRLPRLCLPAPCAYALTRTELGGLIGRPPTTTEWDDYYSRYGDYCRKETVPFDTRDGGWSDPIATAADFWEPLLATYPANAPIRASLASGGGAGGGIPGGAGGGSGAGSTGPADPTPTDTLGTPISSPLEFEPELPGSETDGTGTGRPPPSPIPLPGAVTMWLSAVGCLALWRRRNPVT